MPSPRLVRAFRSPGGTFEVSRPESASVAQPCGRAPEDRPSWASLLYRSGRHRCRPHPIAPVGSSPTASPGIRRARRPFPSIDIMTDGRFPAVSPPLRRRAAAHLALRPRRFARPRRCSIDHSRACCIPLPILGFDVFPPIDRVAAGPVRAVIADDVDAGHLDRGFPASLFRTPRRTPLPRSRTVSPRPLASRTSLLLRSSTVPTLPLPASSMLPMTEGSLSLRSLLRGRVRTVARRLRSARRPVLPWASFPFEAASPP